MQCSKQQQQHVKEERVVGCGFSAAAAATHGRQIENFEASMGEGFHGKKLRWGLGKCFVRAKAQMGHMANRT